MKLLNTLLVFLISVAVYAQTDDSFEKRMNQIYKNSYSKEISDELWYDYVQTLNTRTYNVQPGDTLWDLSVVFFGDGNYWSKIWSYNKGLTNPHLIAVGQDVQFFTGTMEEPPGLIIGDATPKKAEEKPDASFDMPEELKGFALVEGVTEEALVEVAPENDPVGSGADSPKNVSFLYPGAPGIPPPLKPVKPVLENLPSAFKSSEGYDVQEYNENGISMDLRPPVRVNPLFIAHSFLYGGDAVEYPRIGRLLESENGNILLGLNEYFYFESKEKLQLGEELTIMGRDYKFDRNGLAGSVIRFLGIAKIVNRLKDGRFQAVITRSLGGVGGHAWLSREKIPSFNDDYTGRPGQVEFPVIGGGGDNFTRIYGESDVIYLKGGSKAGVRVGDILGVYKNRTIRNKEAHIAQSPLPIGHIKVFRAEPKLTSAFVINSNEVIVPGDITGPPTYVVDQTTPSEAEDLDAIESGLDFKTNTSGNNGEAGSLEAELSEIQ